MNNKEKLFTLIDQHGFIKLCDVNINPKTNRLSFGMLKRGQYTNIIYAICIDKSLVYLGKSTDFWKRTDTYKNAKYWKNAWQSNKNKTNWLEKAINRGQCVEVYYRQCDNYNTETDIGTVSITTMHEEEPQFIQKFNPPWNIQHNKGI